MNGQNDIRAHVLVGITGHRDILAEDEPRVREAVKAILKDYQRRSGTGGVALLTLLSAGADLAAADVALGLGIDVIALFPFSRDLYREDFADERELERFLATLESCTAQYTVPLAPGSFPENLSRSSQARSDQYALAGACMARFAYALIAVWDGLDSGLRGGTSDIVSLKLGARKWPDQYISDKRFGIPVGPVHWVYTRRRKSPDASTLPPERLPFECAVADGADGGLYVSLHPPGTAMGIDDAPGREAKTMSSSWLENFGEQIKLFCAGMGDESKENT